jgi:hypothetical protein
MFDDQIANIKVVAEELGSSPSNFEFPDISILIHLMLSGAGPTERSGSSIVLSINSIISYREWKITIDNNYRHLSHLSELR